MVIIELETRSSSLRSQAYAWSNEDTALVVDGPIGKSANPLGYFYDCPLRALAKGFKLLGPPIRLDFERWLWFLVKE